MANHTKGNGHYDALYEAEDVKRRCETTALYMIETGATVRQAAAKFGISKSTVHKDVTERLEHCAPALSRRVREILSENKAQRHLRGGEATRRKYLEKNLAKNGEKKKNP